MIGKIVAIASLVILPISATMWYRSHANPYWHRFDLTLYKSIWLSLENGVCDMELLSMPTKVASKSEFVVPVVRGQRPPKPSFQFSSTPRPNGYRLTHIAFPLSLSTFLLAITGTVPIVSGPVKRWHRKRIGLCVHCGYNLAGNRTGRCPECGMRHRFAKRFVRAR